MLDFFRSIQFEDKYFFLLLLLLPLLFLWFFYRSRKKKLALKMPSLASLSGVRSIRGIIKDWLPLLRLIAFVSLVIAMARPQKDGGISETKKVIDISLVMDLSSSMLARDFKPDRLEVSKKVASDFIDKRKDDRIGLVVFSGESYTMCPLTLDHEVLKDFLGELECGLLNDGTAIGMGLATAVNHLSDTTFVSKGGTKGSKVVILLTDGVNNVGYIKPMTAAQMALSANVKVYTIGVGSTGDALAPISRRTDGQFYFGLAKVEIDEALLREISKMTGGKYFRATTEKKLEQIYAEIDELERTEVLQSKPIWLEQFRPLVWIAFICLLLEILLQLTVLRTIP